LEQGLRNQIVEVSLELSGRPKRAFECNAHHRVCAALDLAVSHESRKAVRLLSLLPLIWVHVTASHVSGKYDMRPTNLTIMTDSCEPGGDTARFRWRSSRGEERDDQADRAEWIEQDPASC
jgi:hypothetical protein